jgi:predicted DNA-binding transcriptional regulator AlpA
MFRSFGGEEVNEELKALTNRMVSAILVTNPAPHILWGREELKVYLDCEASKLSEYVNCPDFPQPVINESQRRVRWNPQEVIKWYKSYITKLGRPRAA